jgi:hypothetical protein
MNTDKINETLATLETNLRNITAAREQVEMVTNSSDNLLNSVSNLLVEIKQLSNHFKERQESNFKDLKEYKILTDDLTTRQKSFIGEISNTQQKQTRDLEHKLNAIVAETKTDFNLQIKDFKSEIKELKTNTENEILEIKELSINSIKQQTLEISNCLQEFNILSNENNNNIENFEKSLNNKLEANNKKYSIFSVLLIVIIISGFVYININK